MVSGKILFGSGKIKQKRLSLCGASIHSTLLDSWVLLVVVVIFGVFIVGVVVCLSVCLLLPVCHKCVVCLLKPWSWVIKKMLKAHKSVPKRAVKIQRTAFGYQNKQHLAITALAIKSWNECIMGNGQTNSQPDGRTDKISNRRTHTHSRTTEGDRSKDGWLD